MKEELYRKESINRIKTPEDLNSCVKVSNMSVWILLIAIIIFLCGCIFWVIVGRIDKTIEVDAIKDNISVVCIVDEEDISKVNVGMIVKVEKIVRNRNKTFIFPVEGKVTEIGEMDEKLEGYKVYTDIDFLNDIDDAEIVLERIIPFEYILNLNEK